MVSIEALIRQETNPFDPVTFKTGNFWREEGEVTETIVKSIHQSAIQQITDTLKQVSTDYRSRTILLTGDRGSGKSYVLKRLKQTLNAQAFFVYIPPFVESDYIWRHTLRQTVDSLMNVPVGQEESQLLIWLKSLSVFRDRSLMKALVGERGLFIRNFKNSYPSGIYQTTEFFSVLYALTDKKLYITACNWLRGDDLDDDDLRNLGVKRSIGSETDAQGILANLGKVSTSTQPIVLCFDQVETKQLPDGAADLQPIFNVSTAIHNDNLKNFLIIISIATDSWKQNHHRIQQTDKDRIEKAIALRQINLEQAQALWRSRLILIHSLANPKPDSAIYPLQRQALEQTFPGGKATPRNVLKLGYVKYMEFKTGTSPVDEDLVASFSLLWQKEFNLTQQKVTHIRQFSAEELISMLRRAMAALKVREIKHKLLPSSRYSSYSFSYQDPNSSQTIGLVWTEEPNMTSFCRVMEACEKLLTLNECDQLYLIRAESLGKKVNKGYKLYSQTFAPIAEKHFKPDLLSIHCLATYARLVNSSRAGELVLATKTIKPNDLESLVRDSEVLNSCSLLQELRLISGDEPNPPEEEAKAFILNFVKREMIIALNTISKHTLSQFPKLDESRIQPLVRELCQEKEIQILDDSASAQEQILCLIPKDKSNR